VSVSGQQRTFRRNESIRRDTVVEIGLTNQLAGVLHILPSADANGNVWIRASALRCAHEVIKDGCLFEINAPSDRIRFTGIHGADDFLSFSFRTDQPWHRFMVLSMKGTSHINIDIDLIDGYLLNVNHGVHPLKQLADGNWHTAYVDLKTLTLSIDDSDTVISLYTGSGRSVQVEFVDLLINGQVAALQIGEVGDEEIPWQCAGSGRIHVQSTPQILRRICSSAYPSISYCRCKGPNSAVSSFRHQIANCSEPVSSNGRIFAY